MLPGTRTVILSRVPLGILQAASDSWLVDSRFSRKKSWFLSNRHLWLIAEAGNALDMTGIFVVVVVVAALWAGSLVVKL